MQVKFLMISLLIFCSPNFFSAIAFRHCNSTKTFIDNVYPEEFVKDKLPSSPKNLYNTL